MKVPDLRTRGGKVADVVSKIGVYVGWILFIALILAGIIFKGYREYRIWR